MTLTIGVQELKNRASKVVLEVRDENTEFIITHQGKPVAVLRPYTAKDQEADQRQIERELAKMRSLAQRIEQAWISPKSGVELVAEQRR